MLKPVALLLLICSCCRVTAQQADTISVDEVQHAMEILAGDSLQGRGNLQPGLLKAAVYIGKEFYNAGLVPLPGHTSYFIPFRPAGGRKNDRADLLEGFSKGKPATDYIYLRAQPGPYPSLGSGDFSIHQVEAFSDSILFNYSDDTTPLLLWSPVKPAGKKKLNALDFAIPGRGLQRDVLMIVADTIPPTFTLRANLPYFASLEYNVVGVSPGVEKNAIMVTSHYDHEGVINGDWPDTIMNGANDNASGTTAVMMLAKSFAGRSAGAGTAESTRVKPARTMIFAAFAGEELGLTGSTHFTKTEDLKNIIAVINLEMIGLPQTGSKTVFITGEYDSELPGLLTPQLKNAGLAVVKDPVPDKKLFERSDNYPFALNDIPAHTIMSSTDDDECYHQFCDENKRIDMHNLTFIINAVRVALQPFADGSVSRDKIR